MWQALDQQKVFDTTDVIDRSRAIASPTTTFGPIVGPKAKLLSHYIYQGPKNKVNTWLVKQMKVAFRPSAGPLHARRLQHRADDLPRGAGGEGDNVDKMISALEGWQFLGPKGVERIRKADHALIQPMFIVAARQGEERPVRAEVAEDGLAGNVQPPVHPFP